MPWTADLFDLIIKIQNMKWACGLSLLLLLGLHSNAQSSYTPSASNLEARQDFQDRKFGLFIHWGIYSILGDGEWVMHDQHIPYETYSRLASFFYPYAFNAKEWVAMAKAAGMKYITITARHHDGFSMFDTKASPYNIVQATPWHQDPMKALAAECHKQGIKLFFYYSLLDWGRPDYGFGKPIVDGRPQGSDWDHYIQFMKQQLTELLTQYGPIGGIWFDGEWERENVQWHLPELYALIHRLQPQAMIGNNHHHDPWPGEDFQMFERDLPGQNTTGWVKGGVSRLPLETCQTMNNSWGFTINDHQFKSVRTIIHLLVNDAGLNANLLLNVGPMPSGAIQPEFVDTLKQVGEWMHQFGGSIYNTRGAGFGTQPWGTVTQRSDTCFVHVLHFPADSILFVQDFRRPVKAAKTFQNGQAIPFRQVPEGVFLNLKGLNPGAIDNVIELKCAPESGKPLPRERWIMKTSGR